jgi:hypothetical protein
MRELECWTRKLEFLPSGTSSETIYAPLGEFPGTLKRTEGELQGIVCVQRDAMVAKVHRANLTGRALRGQR